MSDVYLSIRDWAEYGECIARVIADDEAGRLIHALGTRRSTTYDLLHIPTTDTITIRK